MQGFEPRTCRLYVHRLYGFEPRTCWLYAHGLPMTVPIQSRPSCGLRVPRGAHLHLPGLPWAGGRGSLRGGVLHAVLTAVEQDLHHDQGVGVRHRLHGEKDNVSVTEQNNDATVGPDPKASRATRLTIVAHIRLY